MSKAIPIACNPSVFTTEQRTAYASIWGELEARKLGAEELEFGIRYRFPGDSDTLRLVHEWVIMERRCCAFLKFKVIAGNESEPVFLEITGEHAAKPFLLTDLQSSINKITESTDGE